MSRGPKVLHDAGVVLLGSIFLLTGLIDCWVDNPNAGSPAPTAPISVEQRELARTIGRDALLDNTDLPTGLMPRQIGVEVANQATLQGYLEEGWIAFATNSWLEGTQDVYRVQHSVYVFDDQVRPLDFVQELAAEMADIPGAVQVSGLPDSTVAYQRLFTRQGENERRTIEMAAVVGRLAVNLDYEITAARQDWREAAEALLTTAVTRATEALTAAGE